MYTTCFLKLSDLLFYIKPIKPVLRFLQMPLSSVCVGSPRSMEFVEGVDYVNFAHFCEALLDSCTQQQATFGKDHVKALPRLAQSNRERVDPILSFQDLLVYTNSCKTVVWI